MTPSAQSPPLLPPISPISPTTAPRRPFCNIRLSNAHQEGLYNLFAGYATLVATPRGENLLRKRQEDLEPRELFHPMITVNYEMYKKIRLFLNDNRVETPSTGASGGVIVNHLLYAIWNRPEDIEERSKAIQQFKDIKCGVFVPSSTSGSNSSPQNAHFAALQTLRLLQRGSHPDQARQIMQQGG